MALETKHKWWQETVFYEIYMASFLDSNGDGIGDFRGLTDRLDYLQDLGVNGLWITPFYPSPKVDNGYDVADYFNVDPDFGSLSDFDNFIEQAHARNIKVIIDVVLNHVSTDHAWFREAVSDPESKYRDYFFFQDVPNGRESFFGGSAWQKEPDGEQVYYHKFSPKQADLNWQNKAVREDMQAVLKFWLDRGVDGFRFDVINFLSCNGVGEENSSDASGKQIHSHDIDQPGIFECISEICTFARDYSKDCFLVGEVGHEELSKLVAYQNDDLLDVVFNFNLGSIASFDIGNVHEQLVAMEDQQGGLPTIFFNSHDMPRSMSRLCQDNMEHAAALAALALTVRGVSFLYFGEEIGMADFIPESIHEMRDVQAINHYQLALDEGMTKSQAYDKALDVCRDKSRLYMQWDEVEAQINDPGSLLRWYKKLIALRRGNPALNLGRYDILSLDKNLLTFSRRWQNKTLHIKINFSDEKHSLNHKLSHEILACRGLDPGEPDYLLPYGILITREVQDVC